MTKRIALTKEEILDPQHWKFEDYKQRITTQQWRDLLLNDDDTVTFQGKVRILVGKYLGAGVYELRKESLD